MRVFDELVGGGGGEKSHVRNVAGVTISASG